jgi:hypothetical protein
MKDRSSNVTLAGSGVPATEPVPVAKSKVDQAKLDAVRAGIKAVKEGRTVPHENMKAWLKSWGTDEELPLPRCK